MLEVEIGNCWKEEIMDLQALHSKTFITLSISREEFDRVHRRSPTVVSTGHGGLDPAYSYVAELPASQMVHANANQGIWRETSNSIAPNSPIENQAECAPPGRFCRKRMAEGGNGGSQE